MRQIRQPLSPWTRTLRLSLPPHPPHLYLGRRLTSSGRKYAVLGTLAVVLAVVATGVLLARAPGDIARNALVQKTIGAGPLIFNSIRDAIPRVPDYSAQLVTLIGPTELRYTLSSH